MKQLMKEAASSTTREEKVLHTLLKKGYKARILKKEDKLLNRLTSKARKAMKKTKRAMKAMKAAQKKNGKGVRAKTALAESGKAKKIVDAAAAKRKKETKVLLKEISQ